MPPRRRSPRPGRDIAPTRGPFRARRRAILPVRGIVPLAVQSPRRAKNAGSWESPMYLKHGILVESPAEWRKSDARGVEARPPSFTPMWRKAPWRPSRVPAPGPPRRSPGVHLAPRPPWGEPIAWRRRLGFEHHTGRRWWSARFNVRVDPQASRAGDSIKSPALHPCGPASCDSPRRGRRRVSGNPSPSASPPVSAPGRPKRSIDETRIPDGGSSPRAPKPGPVHSLLPGAAAGKRADHRPVHSPCLSNRSTPIWAIKST